MDIQELQSFRLSDAVKFNDKLNPRLWGSDEHLLPDVREKLMAIADDFREFLGISDLEIQDITISGSNAAYTYTPHSDIDLHLVVDLPKADISEVYRELFDAKKYQYNDQHDYKIGNYDIELYVQDANKPHHSQGIYSVLNNEWVRVPSRRTPKVDDISVKSKFEDIGRRIEQAVASGNKEQMDAIAGKIKNMRQAGLDSTGEFGPENLAFKALRTQGLLDQLSQARAAAKDAELSITERKKARNKKPKRWGTFGGQWFPGYHNYGQATSEIGDGGADGGGESVAEDQKPKDIKDILPPFIKSCAQYLGLEKTPKIILKRDPEWTRRNGTFGRYEPNTRSVTLAVSGRHTLDILRTLAHELTHARQDELATMPVDAGETGSPYEDDANAQAGRIMRYWVDKHPEFFKDVQLEDYDPNGPPPGPETKPTMPAGTVKVDVSDVYDWYKLGQHISNLKGLGQHDFGQGPPSAIISFGDEDTEHKYIQDLEKTGLTTTDIDPVDPNQPKNIPRQKTDPTYNVTEAFDQPYELLRWEKGDFGDVDAIARLDDGTFLSIMFNKGFGKDTKEETWSVEFWRNNSQEVTGEGDQQRVFATVLSAIQKFIDTEHPAHIRFSANKDVDTGKKSQTRSNLYNKLVQRYANSWGYSVDVDDFADTTVYNLYTLHESVTEGSLEELANTSLKVKEPKNFVNVNDRKQVTYKVMKFKSGKDTYLINFTVKGAPAYGKKSNWNAVNVSFGVREPQDDYSFGDEINTDLTARNKNQFLIYSTVINAVRKFITEYNTEIDEIIMQGAGERQAVMYQRFFQSAGKYFPGWHYDGKHSLVRDVPRQPVKKVREQDMAEGKLIESAVFLNPTTVIVGQAHGQPLELSPNTLKQIQAIAAKHGAWYEGNGTDRGYTKGQIDRYVGSWDDEVAKIANSNDPKWLYVLFANVDANNRVQRVGVDPKDTIFNRLLATAKDNSFQGIGYTPQALQKFLQMASEGQYDFVKMSQQPATQENLTRFLKAGEALMWPSNWEQYPNKAGKIAKAATVDVRDQYLATRKAGVYVTGSGHLKAVQNITGKQGVAEDLDEAVGDNYLYHATMPAGLMRILRTGAIKATDRPQPSTKARTQYPTISTTRSKQYAESDEFVDFLNLTNDGNAVILVFDRNAVANHHKMFGTSQGTQTVGDEFEEVIVAPRGSMPIRGTLKGFYFNPNRTAEIQEYQDVPWFQELLTSPYYMDQKLNEATGFIPVDSKLAHDPRYVSGLTVDIKPGETQRQAKKLGWKIDKNGSPPLLMQELQRQWNIVKESREELDEINMRPSNLKQLSSDVAGAQAGMEFEMIVPDVEGNDAYDEDENAEYESDYEYNTDANDIEQIVEFFNNEEINSYYSIKTLRLKLSEAFDEWKLTEFDNRWRNDPQELVYDYIKDNLSDSEIAQVLDMEFDEDNPPDIGRTEYNLAAEKIVDEQIEPYYEDAEIDARDVFMSDDNLENEWLQSEGYETMQDIESNFDINWPHQNRIDTSDGPGSQSIKDVALNFMNYMGFDTIAVGSRYHDSNYEKYNPGTDDWEDIGSDKPMDSYTIEPDGSLTARSTRDRGLEFVSPPMPMDKMLDNLNRVKAWAKKEGCYTGKDAKTGLHINVSVPGLKNTNTDLDYVKLALLLGDEYVSKEFGRLGEHYAQSALKKVKEAAGRDPARAAEMLNIMRGQMSKLASKIIQSSKVDKFTTIHPKEGYVEFRSPGGDWLDANFSKIEPTLMRFIVALDAAAKPESYREEYLKKLYRLLDPEGGESKGLSGTGTKDTVRYFADFVAGKTPQAALRSFIKQAQLERKLKRGDSEGKKYWWKVSNPGNSNASIDVVALSKNEAIEKAIGPDGYPSWSSNINSLVAKPLRPYEEQSAPTPKYEIYNKQTGNSVEDAEGITNDAEALVRLNDYIEHGPHALQRGQATAMFGIRPVGNAPIRATAGEPQPAGSVGRAATSPTGQWKIIDGLGRQLSVFRPYANTRAAANELAAIWATENDFDGNYQVEPAEEDSTPASDSTATTPRLDRPFVWKVIGASDSPYQSQGTEVVASSEFEAMQKARQQWNLNTGGDTEEEWFRSKGWSANPVRPAPAAGSTTDLAQQRATPGTFTGAWKVTVDGDEVYRFSGVGNNQTDANRVGREWARDQIRQGLLYPAGDIEVVPIMS